MHNFALGLVFNTQKLGRRDEVGLEARHGFTTANEDLGLVEGFAQNGNSAQPR